MRGSWSRSRQTHIQIPLRGAVGITIDVVLKLVLHRLIRPSEIRRYIADRMRSRIKLMGRIRPPKLNKKLVVFVPKLCRVSVRLWSGVNGKPNDEDESKEQRY